MQMPEFPVAALIAIVLIGVILVRFVESRNKAQVQMKAIEKGIFLETLETVEQVIQARNPYERMANFRRIGIVATMAGLGIMFLFPFVSIFERGPMPFVGGVLFGMIPIFAGIGLLIDARLCRQDLENSNFPINQTQLGVPGSEGQFVSQTFAGPATVGPPGESGSSKAATDRPLGETGQNHPVAPSPSGPSEPVP